MGRFVIVAYRPEPGKEHELAAAVQKHLHVLRTEELVTEKLPFVMRASDGTLLEVFGVIPAAWITPERVGHAFAGRSGRSQNGPARATPDRRAPSSHLCGGTASWGVRLAVTAG